MQGTVRQLQKTQGSTFGEEDPMVAKARAAGYGLPPSAKKGESQDL